MASMQQSTWCGPLPARMPRLPSQAVPAGFAASAMRNVHSLDQVVSVRTQKGGLGLVARAERDGRSQLIVYHFMLGPGWDAGCPGCSFLSDHIDGALPHLEHHDVTWTAVSRAPLTEIEAYTKRMGWRFPWASAFGTDFNYDYRV